MLLLTDEQAWELNEANDWHF